MERLTLNGTRFPILDNARHVGRSSPNQDISATIVLEPLEEWEAAVESALISEENRLTYDDLARIGEPKGDEDETLLAYLKEHDIRVVRRSHALHLMQVAGSVSAFEHAFGVELHDHEAGGVRYRLQVGDLSVGLASGDHRILCVLGLDTRPAAHRLAQKIEAHGKGEETTCHKNPRFFADLYQFPEDSAANQRIAILEFGGGYTSEIMTEAFKTLTKSAPPKFTDVSVLGATNQMYSNGYVEVLLDLQVAGAIAPQAEFRIVFAPNRFDAWVHAIDAGLAPECPQVMSISWGGLETSWPAAARRAVDTAFKAACALGVTVLTTSGDTGAAAKPGEVGVGFPSVSPWALCCGGTYTPIDGASPPTPGTEVVWNDNTGATGGGISQTSPVPKWQAGFSLPKPQGKNATAGRGVPDIGANASGNSGYSMLVAPGVWISGCGTSAVGPLMAGLIARLNNLRGSSLGYLNPKLYASATSKGLFEPILQGDNSYEGVTGYPAGSPWNGCTGLGRPKGQAWHEFLG